MKIKSIHWHYFALVVFDDLKVQFPILFHWRGNNQRRVMAPHLLQIQFHASDVFGVIRWLFHMFSNAYWIFWNSFCDLGFVFRSNEEKERNLREFNGQLTTRPIRTRMRLNRHNIIHWIHGKSHRSIHSLTANSWARECRFVFFVFHFICVSFVLSVSCFFEFVFSALRQ